MSRLIFFQQSSKQNVRKDRLTANQGWKELQKVKSKTKNNVLRRKTAYGLDN